MRVLRSILKDSLRYYEGLRRSLQKRLGRLPSGSVKRRRLKGRIYYYLQERQGRKVVHRYLGRKKPAELISAVHERRVLRRELTKVEEALRLIPKRKVAP